MSSPPPSSPPPPSSRGKITAFRFSEDELAMLEMIQGHTGIKSRTEALRAVLEYYIKGKSIEDGAAGESEAPSEANAPGGPAQPKE
jgi:hypothetical protein